MEEELIHLVLRYMNSSKKIDYDFVNTVIMIAIKYYSLYEYIKDIAVFNVGKTTLAAYGIDTHDIIINLKYILYHVSLWETEFTCLQKTPAFMYLYCIYILLHEVEHARQKKLMQETNNIESEILTAAYAPILTAREKSFIQRSIEYKKYRKLYKTFYEYSPAERLADTKSFGISSDISKQLNDESSYNFMYYFQLDSILRGYNVGLIYNLSDEPTKFYLEQLNPSYDYTKIIKMSEGLEHIDLIKFGLSTTHELLNQLAQQRMQLILKLQKNNPY